MTTPDTFIAWLNDQAWPLGIILALILGAYITLRVSAHRRHAALNRERGSVTRESFVSHLEKFGFDPAITGTTYQYLQDVQRVQFPILAGDALDEDLGLDSEDVQQTLHELLVSLNREEAPGVRFDPILTVEDLIRFLQASPRKAQIAKAA